MQYLVIIVSSSDDARGGSDIADMVRVGAHLYNNEADADAAVLKFEDMILDHVESEDDYYIEKREIVAK